jgi:hypothetical protein
MIDKSVIIYPIGAVIGYGIAKYYGKSELLGFTIGLALAVGITMQVRKAKMAEMNAQRQAEIDARGEVVKTPPIAM